MDSKTLKYLMNRTSNRNKDANRNLDKNRIKVEIENCCSKFLESSNDLLHFEVSPRDLDYVVAIVESESISKYDIFQISNTVFGARLKEVELI